MKRTTKKVCNVWYVFGKQILPGGKNSKQSSVFETNGLIDGEHAGEEHQTTEVALHAFFN